MKMLVVTSCTGEKLYHPDNQLTQADFADAETLAKRETELADFKTTAGKIYTGMHHQRLIRQGKMVNTWCDYYVYGILVSDIQ